MYRKLSLILVALIFVIATFCLPVIAEPEDNDSVISSSIQDDTTSAETGSEKETSSKKDTSSKKNTSSKKTSSKDKTSSTVSKYYIPDDSNYFTESLNSLGGNVTSGSIVLDTSSVISEENSSQAPQQQSKRFSLQDVLKRFLWIPIMVIIICILVLIIFNKIYELKYKHIDPKVLIKEQKKAAELERQARKEARRQQQESDDE